MKALWFVSKWLCVEHDGHHWDVITTSNRDKNVYFTPKHVYILNEFGKLFSAFFWCSWCFFLHDAHFFDIQLLWISCFENDTIAKKLLLFKWNCFESMIVHCINKWNRKWPNRKIRIYKIDYHLDVFCSGQSHNHL